MEVFFIGQAHQEYNFQEKFRALIGKTKHSIQHYVEHGFASLPRGSASSNWKNKPRNISYGMSNREPLIGEASLIK